MKTLSILLLCASCATAAEPALTAPHRGFLVDANGSLRPVLGVSGNLMLGDSIGEDVLATAWSDVAGMVKTGSALMILDAQGQIKYATEAEAGRALFAFDKTGAPALAYLPDSATLLIWRADHFDSLHLPGDVVRGRAVALAAAEGRARLVLQRAHEVWQIDLSLSDGQLTGQQALPRAGEPLLLTSDGTLLYAWENELIVRTADGREQRVESGIHVSSASLMASQWVVLEETGSGRQFAVRLGQGAPQMWQLPEGRQ